MRGPIIQPCRTRKLTAEQAVDIFVTAGRHKVIARRFGVSASIVSKIKTRAIHREATKWWAELDKAAVLNAALAVMACDPQAAIPVRP